ncbi:MAG: DUF1684 domain-containing protein [Candidatus Omnitrophota bacterium]|nr:DUF1684 domain-containing protein [Candidatus Omnitrophota bacterium]
MDISEWKKQLEKERSEKDEFFIADPNSPIPLENRFKFEGLKYYPLNQDYRFELELWVHSEKKVLDIEDTQGEIRRFIQWGEFRFRLDEKECAIQAYKTDANDQDLFISFRDKTSGSETYGAGRYLDFSAERDINREGKWILDFNRAYNPFCAYNKAYACPLAPLENSLEVKIQAGEKNPS